MSSGLRVKLISRENSRKQKYMENHTLYNKSIENSYKILFENFDFEELIFSEGDELTWVFFTEPGETPSIEELEEMIDYFAKDEEYEKCHKLKTLITEHRKNVIGGVDFTDSINKLNNLF